MWNIYTNCVRVVVWLGPSTRHSDEYIDFVTDTFRNSKFSKVLDMQLDRFNKLIIATVNQSADDGLNENEAHLRHEIMVMLATWKSRFPVKGAMEVLGRPWFGRLWIIQELCLAPEVVFACGDRIMSDDDFRCARVFIVFIQRFIAAHHPDRPIAGEGTRTSVSKKWQKMVDDTIAFNRVQGAASRLAKVRKDLRKTNAIRMSLFELVKHYNVTVNGVGKVSAKEPRDRIYGLLGLANHDDPVRGEVEKVVDYNKSDANIFTDFAGKVIRYEVDILLFSQFPKSKLIPDLPSWVPDWTADLKIPYGYFDLTRHAFSAGSTQPEETQVAPSVCIDSGTLTIRGYRVDMIANVGEQVLLSEGDGDTDTSVNPTSFKFFVDELESFLADSSKLLLSPYQSEESRREAAARIPGGGLSIFFGSNDKNKKGSKEVLQHLHEQMKIRGENNSMIEASESLGDRLILRSKVPTRYLPKALIPIGLRIADVLGSIATKVLLWFGILRYLLSRAPTSSAEAFRLSGMDQDIARLPEAGQYRSSILKNINRKLFMTEKGYIGLCSPRAKTGDTVVIFPGSTVPHVLRPKGCEGQQRYSYIGEAYCDGFMEGEILKSGNTETFNVI
jgi:hypothetical protein